MYIIDMRKLVFSNEVVIYSFHGPNARGPASAALNDSAGHICGEWLLSASSVLY